MAVMTIHVLHAGDGYLYLIRSVAAHDGQLGAGESLAAYYTASGQPPGRWAGRGADRLGVRGSVTEDQMRALFGEGLHPNCGGDQDSTDRRMEPPSRAAQQEVRLGQAVPAVWPAAAS